MEYLIPEDVIKLVIAIFVGGVIGAEREFRDKQAGFRTIIFISLGAALFTILSLKVGVRTEPGRIAAQIVSGVGFLGAGAILRDGSRITGLTTASMIWLAAALGMAVGAGHIWLSLSGVLAISVVLWIFPLLEVRIDRLRDARSYELVCQRDPKCYTELDQIFRNSGLKIGGRARSSQGDELRCSWYVTGSPEKHDQLFDVLIHREDVKELKA